MGGEFILLPLWISVGGGFTGRGEFDAWKTGKLCLSFLKFQFLAKMFGETFIMSLKSTSFSKEL